ncbi:unnamed protein product [[Actinomadura] parvosata subsp. kistnae]|uniref:Photosynthesis system II assembly factor Ycf48/Hcf136-like domain-containing protein n=1 Tax=[Actinomadura] parvosata subsp. kistnae TaxID=1909395 RepID=A0A1U9ZW76_9ACTN|nr:hypothetical protein [Nonomuraea sp. ATCC 55076]AQZ62187.1 hypothetical protein BKM31_12545 [Nonomuraea sp. ATCC 55076]SPL95947.1 unnamed protein product [Actinomadura parvosata subsp. kistnae]
MILNVVLALSLAVTPAPQWRKVPADSPAFLTKDHEIDGRLAIALDWEKRPIWRMMHWTGRAWRTTKTPAAFASGKNARISRSWAFAGKDGVIHAWRISGTTWKDHPIRKAGRLVDATGSSAGEVWVAGAGGRTWRWDGAAWHRQDTPRAVARLLATSEGVWALSADRRVPLHWDGGRWEETPLPGGKLPPTPKGGISGTCGTKWTEPAVEITDWAADAAGDVWAAAEVRSHAAKCVGHVYSTLKTLALHWDGGQWRRVDLPVELDRLEHVVADAAGAVWFGSDRRPELVLRAGAWQRVKAPRGLGLLEAMGPAADGRGIWVWTDVIHRLS